MRDKRGAHGKDRQAGSLCSRHGCGTNLGRNNAHEPGQAAKPADKKSGRERGPGLGFWTRKVKGEWEAQVEKKSRSPLISSPTRDSLLPSYLCMGGVGVCVSLSLCHFASRFSLSLLIHGMGGRARKCEPSARGPYSARGVSKMAWKVGRRQRADWQTHHGGCERSET